MDATHRLIFEEQLDLFIAEQRSTVPGRNQNVAPRLTIVVDHARTPSLPGSLAEPECPITQVGTPSFSLPGSPELAAPSLENTSRCHNTFNSFCDHNI
jgi:hypothetical protein